MRPQRLVTAASLSGTAVARPRKVHRTETGGVQLHLDVGQRSIGIETCVLCGMVYNRVEADMRLHAKVCHTARQGGAAAPAATLKALGDGIASLLNLPAGASAQESVVVTMPLNQLRPELSAAVDAVLTSSRGVTGDVGGDYCVPTSTAAWRQMCAAKHTTGAVSFMVAAPAGVTPRCVGFAFYLGTEQTIPIARRTIHRADGSPSSSPSASPAASRAPSPDPEAPAIETASDATYSVVRTQLAVVDMWVIDDNDMPRPKKTLATLFARQKCDTPSSWSVRIITHALVTEALSHAVYGCQFRVDQAAFSIHLTDPAAPGGDRLGKALQEAFHQPGQSDLLWALML
jgi:hypothetical protein